MEVSKWNFIPRQLDLKEDYVPLFMFVEKKALLNVQTGEYTIGLLPPFLQNLFRLFCWLAHNFGGGVYVCYMEQIFFSAQVQQLSPPLRCSLASEVCFIFLLKKTELSGDTSDTEFLNNILHEDDVNTAIRYKDRLVHSIKKFICHHMMLVSREMLYTTSNSTNQDVELVELVDWSTCNYKRGHVSKKTVEMYGGTLFRTAMGAGNEYDKYTMFTFLSAAARYFIGAVEEDDADDPRLRVYDSEFVTWGAIAKFMDPGLNPLFQTVSRDLVGAPVLRFIEALLRGTGSGPIDTSDVLLFRYDINELFNIKNFKAYEGVPLLGYPFTTSPLAAPEDYVDYGIKNGIATNTFSGAYAEKYSFKVLFPHLSAIRGIVEELDKTRALDAEKTRLDLKLELLKTVLVKNAAKITISPINGIFAGIKRLLDGGRPPAAAFALPPTLGHVFMVPTPAIAVKVFDTHIMRKLFVNHIGIIRCNQATLQLTYTIYNTAPRWKLCRPMIVNHTRPGQGKTFTNEVLIQLFSKAGDVFEELSNFTTTSFKYTPRTIGKVMIMDDVGFTPEQQKVIAREDNIVQNHFKCMLDKGYTNNNVTQWDADKQRYSSNKIVAIQNTGFIWNTNTLAPFGGALRDRSIILGPEPLTKVLAMGDVDINRKVADHGLAQLTTTLLYRQHLFQTIIYTLTQEPGLHEQHVKFLKVVLDVFNNNYPSMKQLAGSLARDDFKILDMALADAIRLAITAVVDMWLPPWTEIPETRPGETVSQYIGRLNLNRLKAVAAIDLGGLVVEILAQLQIFLPSSIIQMAATLFNQETGDVITRVCEFFDGVLKSKRMDVSLNDDGTLRINNPQLYDGNFELDMPVFRSAKLILVQKNGVGETARLITGFTMKDKVCVGVHVDPGVFVEIYKTHRPRLFETLWGELVGSFETQPDAQYVHYMPADSMVGNLLSIFALNRERGIFGEHGKYQIHREFQGIETELGRRAVVGAGDIGAKKALLDQIARADLGLSHHSVNGKVVTRGDLIVDEATGCSSFEGSSFHAPAIKRFSANYINNRDLLGLFSHCKAVMYAMGNVIRVCRPKVDDVEGSGWEYSLAEDIYAKYGTGGYFAEDVRKYMTRYICSTVGGDDDAASDPYFQYLRETGCEAPASAYFPGCGTVRSLAASPAPSSSGGSGRRLVLDTPEPSSERVSKKRKMPDECVALALKIQRTINETFG